MSQSKPVLMTTISGTGPLMGLDLTTVSAATMLPIVQAAQRVIDEWNSVNITTEYLGAQQAMEDLVKASSALDKLFVPIIPGEPTTGRMDLMNQDTYPVIREGDVRRLKLDELTAVELEAVFRWLDFHSLVAAGHAEVVRDRAAQLASAVA